MRARRAALGDSPETPERHYVSRPRGGGVGSARKIAIANEFQPEDESSLYFIIKNGKASLQQVVDDWIDTYKVTQP
jgi:hypothetical protein